MKILVTHLVSVFCFQSEVQFYIITSVCERIKALFMFIQLMVNRSLALVDFGGYAPIGWNLIDILPLFTCR